MSKHHDLGFVSFSVEVFLVRAVFLWAKVPLSAAAIDKEGGDGPKVGGAKRLRGWVFSILPRARVGDRPAAAGADMGVIEDLDTLSRRGVCGIVI